VTTLTTPEVTTGPLTAITGPLERILAVPGGGRWQRLASTWELWAILAAQLALTAPWLWRTAPFTDEALYLDAGHHEWAHWLHHAPLADYASWFSGAPVIYPPLAAAADSAGGLVAARALSLVFMLASTALIFLTARRLFGGRLPGVLAALLFAVCGLVVHYGGFATFGPPAMFLLVVATWAATRIADGGAVWLPLCAVALVAADATKYAALAWDPVVIGIVVLHGWDKGRWRALSDAASAGLTVGVLGIGLLMLGGADFSRGFIVTTLFRSIHLNEANSAASVLLRALALTGVLVGPAILGTFIALARREPLPRTLLLGLFAMAGVLAAVDQARIHQLSSLDKNLGFGLPFAALGAGYAVSAGRRWAAQRFRWGNKAAVVACVALVLATLIAGRLQKVQFRGQGIRTAGEVVAAVRKDYVPGTYIVSDGAARMEQYYLPSIGSRWWVGTFTPTPRQNAAITGLICSGQVSVVVLRKNPAGYDHRYDLKIIAMLARSGLFRPATVTSQGSYSTQVWKLTDPDGTGGQDARGCE
jgi:Dolichyl-phosphate-mannose-protein mannosyltransferase